MLLDTLPEFATQPRPADAPFLNAIKVLQRQRTDCGVACLAMVADVAYETAAAAFVSAGLHVQRKKKQPFASNFKELSSAAAHVGLELKRQAFRSWDDLQAPTILKVSNGRSLKGDWHWVVAQRTPEGIEILDPATELPSYSYPQHAGGWIDFSIYQPTGHILTRAHSNLG